MKFSVENKFFRIGFFLSLIVFFSLNIGAEFLQLQRDHYDITLGFPLTFYHDMNTQLIVPKELLKEEGFFYINFIVDALIAIIFSFLLGLIFKFVWAKISEEDLK